MRRCSHWSLPPTAFVGLREFREVARKCRGPAKNTAGFVRGGHWRGFLAKYDESNLMHKKMLWVSDALAQAEADRPDAPEIAEARATSMPPIATAPTGTVFSAGSTCRTSGRRSTPTLSRLTSACKPWPRCYRDAGARLRPRRQSRGACGLFRSHGRVHTQPGRRAGRSCRSTSMRST